MRLKWKKRAVKSGDVDKRLFRMYFIFQAIALVLSGCGKDNEATQPGTTAPQATIQKSNQPAIGAAEQEYQKAKDEEFARALKEDAARARGELPPVSQFKFPNTYDPEQPLPKYQNFYSINDHYPQYLLCEYDVDKKVYNQSDEPKWFEASLGEARKSGPTKFPPLEWIAVIIINRAEWKGLDTFVQAHKVGAVFKASDVFNPSCDLTQLVARAGMDRHPFMYDTSQPTPGDQQRWLMVERHAATNHATTGKN